MVKERPKRRFQVSLKSLLTFSVFAAMATALIFKIADAGPLAFGLVILWLIVSSPFFFVAEVVDWLLGVNQRKQ